MGGGGGGAQLTTPRRVWPIWGTLERPVYGAQRTEVREVGT